MNRPYLHKGRPVPGVFQRCAKDCPRSRCKKDHKWAYDVELPPDAAGNRKRRIKGGFHTATDAVNARAALLKQHRDGLLPENGATTVATWLREWLVNQDEVRGLRDGTLVDYRRHVESYWIPEIGHLKLTDLRPQHVTNTLRAIRIDRDKSIKAATALKQQYAEQAATADEKRKEAGRKRPVKPKKIIVPRPFSTSTALRVHSTLRSALNAAVRAQEIVRNVATLAELPRETHRRVKPWTPEQLGGWLDAIAGERFYPLFHLAAYTGMRRGELCGLSWDDVDLEAGLVTIAWQITDLNYRKAVAAEKRGEPIPYRVRPKTADGEDRTIDIDAGTVAVLKAWRRQQVKERLKLGRAYRDRDNLVFTREDGQPLDPQLAYTTFKRLIRRNGLPEVPLHHLRHGAASIQIEAGIDIAVISKRLGHSRIGLTSDTYGHLIGTVGKTAAETAAAIVPRRQVG